MKNKKYIIGLIVLILILLVLLGIFVFAKKAKNNATKNTIESSEEGLQETFTIQSTKNHPIQKDDIEATKIEVVRNSDEYRIHTTLKNNSQEPIQGFFITLSILDEKGNTVTSISENSLESIPVNSEIVLTNYVTGIDKNVKCSSAKIDTLEKNNIKDSLENAFDTMDDAAIHANEVQE